MSGDRAPALVKCLVWDLDGTLLRGTLLEDGGVGLREGVLPVVRELDARGILQSVASRNDADLAWRRLAELGVAEYFVVPRIDWGPKSASIRAIADRLGFAHRAVAFIDDQPAERAEVAFHLPDVRCYPAEQATALPGLAEFSPTVTDDARRRRRLYQVGLQRDAQRAEFTGADDEFQRSLALVLTIARATAHDLPRLEELISRTSQMNATGRHHNAAELRSLLAAGDHELLVVSLTDRFGPYGTVGVVLLAMGAHAWRLRLLVTSCRVIPCGTGSAVLRWLVDQAARAGVHLVADFRRTERNRIMEVTYRFAGFTDRGCACLSTLTGTAPADGGQLLHLEPVELGPLTTMRLLAPHLGPDRPPS